MQPASAAAPEMGDAEGYCRVLESLSGLTLAAAPGGVGMQPTGGGAPPPAPDPGLEWNIREQRRLQRWATLWRNPAAAAKTVAAVAAFHETCVLFPSIDGFREAEFGTHEESSMLMSHWATVFRDPALGLLNTLPEGAWMRNALAVLGGMPGEPAPRPGFAPISSHPALILWAGLRDYSAFAPAHFNFSYSLSSLNRVHNLKQKIAYWRDGLVQYYINCVMNSDAAVALKEGRAVLTNVQRCNPALALAAVRWTPEAILEVVFPGSEPEKAVWPDGFALTDRRDIWAVEFLRAILESIVSSNIAYYPYLRDAVGQMPGCAARQEMEGIGGMEKTHAEAIESLVLQATETPAQTDAEYAAGGNGTTWGAPKLLAGPNTAPHLGPHSLHWPADLVLYEPLMREVVKVRAGGLAEVPTGSPLLKNYHLVSAALQRDGFNLRYAHPTLRRDPTFVERAVEQDGRALKWALLGKSTQVDQNILARKALLGRNGHVSIMTAPWFSQIITANLDSDVVYMCVDQDWRCFKAATAELRGEVLLAKVAVAGCGWALEHVRPEAVTHELVREALLGVHGELGIFEFEWFRDIVKNRPDVLEDGLMQSCVEKDHRVFKRADLTQRGKFPLALIAVTAAGSALRAVSMLGMDAEQHYTLVEMALFGPKGSIHLVEERWFFDVIGKKALPDSVLLRCIEQDWDFLLKGTKEQRANPAMVMLALERDVSALIHAVLERMSLKDRHSVVRVALLGRPEMMTSNWFRTVHPFELDNGVLLECMQRDINCFRFASEKQRGLSEIAMPAVQLRGDYLQHVPPGAVTYEMVIEALLGSNGNVHIANTVWYLRITQQAGHVAAHLRNEHLLGCMQHLLPGDDDLMAALLRMALDSQRRDAAIMREAVRRFPSAILEALPPVSEELIMLALVGNEVENRADDMVVLAAVTHDPRALFMAFGEVSDAVMDAALFNGPWSDASIMLDPLFKGRSVTDIQLQRAISGVTGLTEPLPGAFRVGSASQRTNREIVLTAVGGLPLDSIENLRFVPTDVLAGRRLLSDAGVLHAALFGWPRPRLRKKQLIGKLGAEWMPPLPEKIWREAVGREPRNFSFAPSAIKAGPLGLFAMSIDDACWDMMPPEVKQSCEPIVEEMMRNYIREYERSPHLPTLFGLPFERLNPEQRRCPALVAIALKYNIDNISHAVFDTWSDKAIIPWAILAIEKDPSLLRTLPDRTKTDKRVIDALAAAYAKKRRRTDSV